jgi:hypothetical protein
MTAVLGLYSSIYLRRERNESFLQCLPLTYLVRVAHCIAEPVVIQRLECRDDRNTSKQLGQPGDLVHKDQTVW